MKGRTALPTETKKLRGTHRASRAKNEPKLPVSGMQPAPSHLSVDSKKCWKIFCALASAMRVLTEGDLHALERLSECAGEVRELRRLIKKVGYTYEAENGLIKANPAVAMLADADRRLLSYMTNFGMTPAARTKVTALDGTENSNPEDEFFH